jgi:hypothetical protein
MGSQERIAVAVLVATACMAQSACGGSSPTCGNVDSGALGDGFADGWGSGNGSGNEDGSTGPGMVLVEAAVTYCGSVSPISVSPVNGGVVSLSANVFGPTNNGPPPALQWTAPSGTFSEPNNAGTSFTCGGPGPVTVTLTATSLNCHQTASATVVCS